MPLKTLFFAVILAVAPGLALAEGCSHDNRQAMSCADGYDYDHTTGVCVVTQTS